MEREITQPAHCGNIRPEGLCPMVLLEVNTAGTQAKESLWFSQENMSRLFFLTDEHLYDLSIKLVNHPNIVCLMVQLGRSWLDY